MDMKQVVTVQEKGGIVIPKEMAEAVGTDLRYSCLDKVMLLILRASDKRFPGDLLTSDGSIYLLPEHILSELRLNRGDRIKLIYNSDIGFIIGVKVGNNLSTR